MTWRAGVAFLSCALLAWTSIATTPSFAQGYQPVVASTQPSLVVGTFSAYPTGGPGLREGIKNLVLREPTLATEIAEYLRSGRLSPAQREATEQGLADALNLLLLRGEDTPGVGINPTTALLIAVLAGGIGAGAYFLSTNKSDSVSPN